MSNFQFALSEYEGRIDKCVDLLSDYLNEGFLALVLGSGASSGLNLPSWYTLVTECVKEVFPEEKIKTEYSNHELKQLSNQVKDKVGNREYIILVKKALYKDVSFDFQYAKKDLLISLTSLIVGKTRGTVKNILTYNFDSVLEWYLKTNGLRVNVTTLDRLFNKSADVDIIHIHGYLPHGDEYGIISESIVLAKEEFEDRQVGQSYYKDLMMMFFRRQVFLTVGLSASSIIDDICPYLRLLNRWYNDETIERKQPYGVAFLTRCSSEDARKLKEHGVIPCVLEIPQIYASIFQIAQKAIR